MDIDNLTIGEARKIAQMFGGLAPATSPHIGQKCVIRCYASGVHFGTIIAHNGREVTLSGARRLWRWDAKDHGISLSEVANHGGTSGCHRFCEVVEIITLLDAIEIIPASAAAASEIEAAPIAKGA